MGGDVLAVPAGWQRTQLGQLLAEHGHRVGKRDDLPPLSLTKAEGLVPAAERFGRALHSKDVSAYRVVRPDDIVIDPMLLWDGACARQTSQTEGFVSPDYRVFEPTSRVEPSFIDYAMQGPHLRGAFKNAARGTNKRRNRIGRGDFERIAAPLPPLPEQRKIAAILGAVDRALDATRTLIAQNRQVSVGLLEKLLTRGVAPDGKPHQRLRDSELGPIPEAWKVLRLREALTGSPSNGVSPATAELGTPTFSIAAVRDGGVQIERHIKWADTEGMDEASLERFRVQEGDVLLIRGNANPSLVATAGIVRSHPVGCIYPDLLMRLTPKATVDARFLVYLINSPSVHDRFLRLAKTTNGTLKVNGRDVSSVQIPMAPLDEQHRIVAILDAVDAELRTEQAKLTALTTLKAGLLQDLLSGRVRVKP